MSGVSFSLKRKASEAASAPAKPNAAFEESNSKKSRGQNGSGESVGGVAEFVDGTVVGSNPGIVNGPLVIPLKVRNDWNVSASSSPAVTSLDVIMVPDKDETSSRMPGSRPSPAPSATASTNSLSGAANIAAILEKRAGSKWGLQLRNTKSTSSLSLVSQDPSVASSSSLAGNGDDNESSSLSGVVDTRTLEERAIVALLAGVFQISEIEESRKKLKHLYVTTESTKMRPDILPILQQNAVPGINDILDPKEKYLHDVKLRPDEATLEDFEQVPIEDFGLAMLRGMGYKDEDK
ncbi:hypothetical protein HK100_000256 [Physocladia obscura]|uniref:Spp2/MOS2 G-patch domain-containing protein n=1 Tax=Physocladia obscura TaxID=109957 RepID=A0AAD5XBX9_9FUNG|nr:hypothetical protein HK100_000256 [Physocladia obscura]